MTKNMIKARVGKFKISRSLMDNTDLLIAAQEGMGIIWSELEPWLMDVRFTAICEEFDLVPSVCEPPEYELTMSEIIDGDEIYYRRDIRRIKK